LGVVQAAVVLENRLKAPTPVAPIGAASGKRPVGCREAGDSAMRRGELIFNLVMVFGPITIAVLGTMAITMLGCARSCAIQAEQDTRPNGARLTSAEAIRVAKEAAEGSGRHLADYRPPEARYDYTRNDKSWHVYFGGKDTPGHHFSVEVDDQTGRTKLRAGK
jgi:hypothetical protein